MCLAYAYITNLLANLFMPCYHTVSSLGTRALFLSRRILVMLLRYFNDG